MKSVIFSGVFLVAWDSQFQANSLNKALGTCKYWIYTHKEAQGVSSLVEGEEGGL